MGSTPSFPPCPPPALAAAGDACGEPLNLTELTNRRGSAVWKGSGSEGAVAIKLGHSDGAEEHVAREAANVERIGLPYRLASGATDQGAWMVTRWLEGPTTGQLHKPLRQCAAGGRKQSLAAATDLCHAVAELHAKGWAHGDLQPSHAIHTADGVVQLIDVAWAAHPDYPPVGFRGGIVHLIAPELAAAITAHLAGTVPPPAPTTGSDVYALAGTLWTCATGRWPLDYRAADIDPAAGVDVLREAIATGGIPLAADTPWPELHDVLGQVLTAPPERRPTARQLAEQLVGLTP